MRTGARVLAAVLGVMIAAATSAQEAAPSARSAPLPETQWSAQTRAQIAGTLPRVSALKGEGAPQPKPLPILPVIAHHPTSLAEGLGVPVEDGLPTLPPLAEQQSN